MGEASMARAIATAALAVLAGCGDPRAGDQTRRSVTLAINPRR